MAMTTTLLGKVSVPCTRAVLVVGLIGQLAVLPALFAQQTNVPTEMKPVIVTGSFIPTAETVGRRLLKL